LSRRRMRSQRGHALWLRRHSARYHYRPTQKRNKCNVGLFMRHTVVADVSTHNRALPLSHCGCGLMQASPQFGFHRSELRLQALAHRLPQHR